MRYQQYLGRDHRLLALTMEPDKYFVLTGNNWVEPIYLGSQSIILAGTFQVQVAYLYMKYDNYLQ